MENVDSLYDVAVVGMVGRFPGADDLDQFWRNLCDGVESVTFFTDEELLQAGVAHDLLSAPNYVKASAVVSGIDRFDARHFGIAPGEAEMMDPQQRIFLECAWQALESAGYNPEQYDGCIGVYAGASMNTYFLNNLSLNPERLRSASLFQVMISGDKDFLATQVSYRLNLHGPSFTVQTACSTSLVAVHIACQALLNRECDVALAGGVSLKVPQSRGYLYEEGGILSPDGHCRPFDARAHGTVNGNGVGIVVLKRLADALEDGDTIHAVIKGSAINNDGARKVGYTAPSEDGQAEVITEALAVADVDPATITYVEAHGTGTVLGDPVEVAALTRVFRASTEAKTFCALGSVKSNIGHLDAAAGVAGLTKTILALKHKQLPPSLHFTEPNPKIDLANSPFYVNAELRDWRSDGQTRRAGVSSFGIGGTNAHVVLEEAPPVRPTDPGRAEHLLILSAKTEEALEKTTANLAAHLRQHPEVNLADAAYTLQVGRHSCAHRRIAVCKDVADAAKTLETVDPKRVLTAFEEPRHRPLFFVFPGQGTQYVNMGRGLYQDEPLFRATVDRCVALIEPYLGLNLLDVLYPDDKDAAAEQLNQTAIAQPALFTIEFALAKLWQAWGLQPDGMIGHSIGEYVAACLTGVFTLENALALVVQRGQLIQQLPGGSMLSVSMSEAEIRPFLNDTLSLAAVNSPRLCTVSGPDEAIKALQAQLEPQEVVCTRLSTSHAFHSAMIEPIQEKLTECARRAAPRPPDIPFVSNVTGTWITPEEATDPHYWARHSRQTVQFADGLRTLLAEEDQVLLEVGPGHTLTVLARQQRATAAFTSMRRAQDEQADRAFLLTTLGRLWLSGLEIDWRALYGDERRRRTPLPTYPFAHDRYWLDSQSQTMRQNAPVASLEKKPAPDEWLYVPYWKPSTTPASTITPTVWLILSEDAVLSAQLAMRLRAMGHTVNTVQAGTQFSTLDANTYTVDPQRPEDYGKLLTALVPVPQRAVYCTTQTFDFYGLVFLAQALDRHGSTNVHLDIVTHGAQQVAAGEVSDPIQSLVLGPALVIPQECPNLTCRAIDAAAPPHPWQATQFYDDLLAELTADTPDVMVAYRDAQRWVQTFEKVQSPGNAAGCLREGGVYLITGGLGRIGRTLARYLAETAQAKLALVSRTGLPPREGWAQQLARNDPTDRAGDQIRFVQALEAQGTEVLVIAADVADRDQMQAAVAQTYRRFGALHGVLHAAGIVGNDAVATLQAMTRDVCETQFRPKVQGTLVLAEVLREHKLDFCMLFSSLSAVLGGLGYTVYAAANRFMDAFAQRHNQTQPTPWLSVNWDSWQFSDRVLASGFGASMVRLSMSPEEGVQVFRHVLSLGRRSPVVVSTGDLQARLDLWVTRHGMPEDAKPPVSLHARPRMQTAYVAPCNETEEKLAAIWQQLLGIADVGVHDNFFELGGHSLLLAQIHTRVQKTFGRNIPITQLFQYPTIHGLAVQLSQTQEEEPTLGQIGERGRRSREALKQQRQKTPRV
jgi:acyl transferase domain-containing protein